MRRYVDTFDMDLKVHKTQFAHRLVTGNGREECWLKADEDDSSSAVCLAAPILPMCLPHPLASNTNSWPILNSIE